MRTFAPALAALVLFLPLTARAQQEDDLFAKKPFTWKMDEKISG